MQNKQKMGWGWRHTCIRSY